jgi:L-fuconolactonase
MAPIARVSWRRSSELPLRSHTVTYRRYHPFVIDAHHHLWDLATQEHNWLMGGQPWASDEELARLRRSFTLADLVPLAAAAEVTGTVLVQTVTEPWETPDLLAWAGGLVAAVVGWTDLAAPDVADAVAELRGLPGGAFLRGIRHPLFTEPDPDWLARPAVLAGLRALAEAGLSFDVIGLPDQLSAVVTAARAVPELMFVINHLGAPSAVPGQEASAGPWAPAIRRLASLPNVTCKLSGMPDGVADASDLRPYSEIVLAAFGPGRLMFGTDWPVCTLAAPYHQVCGMYRELTAQLSPAEQDAIFDGTARRVYRLP